MATFPTHIHLRSGTIEFDAGILSERSSNGFLRHRVMYPTTKRTFRPELWVETTAAKDALIAFYNANKLLDVDYVDANEGGTHVVKFATAPEVIDMTPYWMVRLTLAEV